MIYDSTRTIEYEQIQIDSMRKRSEKFFQEEYITHIIGRRR